MVGNETDSGSSVNCLGWSGSEGIRTGIVARNYIQMEEGLIMLEWQFFYAKLTKMLMFY